MDLCWKNLAEKFEVEVLDRIVKQRILTAEAAPLEWRRVRKNKKYRIRKCVRRLLGKSLLFVQRIQLAASANVNRGESAEEEDDEAAAKNDDYEGSDEGRSDQKEE